MITRAGKDRRAIDPTTGKRIGRDTRSFTATVDLGTGPDRRRLRQWKSFPTRHEAEVWETETKGSVHRGTYVQPTDTYLRDYLQEWLTGLSASLKPTTAKPCGIVVEKYINPTVGNVRVRDLTEAHIGKMLSELTQQGLSSRTVQYAGSMLKQALRSGVKRGLLGCNPAEFVDLPRVVATREMQAWTGAEVARFLEKLVASAHLPKLTLHGLRHTWATLALQAGINPKVVQERLGRFLLGSSRPSTMLR